MPSHQSGMREELYSVRVNGELVSDGSIVLTDGGGRLYASTEDLVRWRLRPPPGGAVIMYRGVRYVPLAAYAGLIFRVVAKDEELDLSAPAQAFTTTSMQIGASDPAALHDEAAGSYINYALHGVTGSGAPSLVNGYFDLGASERSGGAFRTSFFASDLPHSAQMVRLDTVWAIDNPTKHQSVHIGDYFTQPRALGIPFRFGGLSFGTDFTTDPQFITFPTPSMRGLAALPSTVDVFVNGFQAGSATVPSGPFDLGAIPAVEGQNQAQVVVRDITGAQHVVTLSFYASPTLLKRGLSNYSIQAGAERLDYGISSMSYGPTFAEGTWREGLSDEFTLELHGETTAAFNNYGVAVATPLKEAGTLSAGVQASSARTGAGYLGQVGYEYRSPAFNVFAQLQSADQNYWELGYSTLLARPRQLWQSGISFNIGRGNQLSLTSIDRSAWGDGSQHISLATLSHGIRHGSIVASYATSTNGMAPTLSLALVTSLGAGESTYASSSLQGGKLSQDVAYQSGTPSAYVGDTLNVLEHSGDARSVFAQDTHQTPTVSEGVGVTALNNQASVTGDLSGSLVLLGGKLHAARQISGSYGLVSVPRYAGAGVLLNNQQIGTTDKNGDFVVTNLDAYNRNLISLDAARLPIGANIASFNATAVPARNGAVAVRFATQRPGGIRITVVDSSGRPLPAGSSIEDAAHVRWPIAEDGDTYLAGVVPGTQTLKGVSTSGNPCEFTITVPDDTSELPNLGTFTCRDQ